MTQIIFGAIIRTMSTPTIQHMALAVLEAYGWTQVELAERVGLTQASVNRLLRGLARTTSYEPGARIAALYAARPAKPIPRVERRGRPRKERAA